MKRDIATWTRWLHIYISMFSFLLILFFAITGITLNHPDWLAGKQQITQHTGKLSKSWLETDGAVLVNKLKLVEHFRNNYSIKSSLADFSTDENQCTLSFKGPGYAADIFIDRATGEFELTITSSGLVAMMNDLHKGRDTSEEWKWVIDVAAAFMIFVSLTGFVMIFFFKKKRASGLLVVLAGGIVSALLYWLL